MLYYVNFVCIAWCVWFCTSCIINFLYHQNFPPVMLNHFVHIMQLPKRKSTPKWVGPHDESIAQ